MDTAIATSTCIPVQNCNGLSLTSVAALLQFRHSHGWVDAAVEDGATHVNDLEQELGIAACCGQCRSCARDVLDSALGAGTARIGHAA